MKALLIEYDSETGIRPGGINPRIDQGLRCPSGWQNPDANPAVEIRLVSEGIDAKKFEGVAGITVLDGKEAINAAVKAHIPMSRKHIFDHALVIEHMKAKNISLDQLAGKTGEEVADFCAKNKLAGVMEIKTRLLE